MESRRGQGIEGLASGGPCSVVLAVAGESADLFMRNIGNFEAINIVRIAREDRNGTHWNSIPLFDCLVPNGGKVLDHPRLSAPGIQAKV